MQWFHAHIYFNNPRERELAMQLREQLQAQGFKTAQISRLVDRPIGPHPYPMFEADFQSSEFTQIITWLMYHRTELSILIHPVTEPEMENAPMDHTDRAMWLGESVPLNIDVLRS